MPARRLLARVILLLAFSAALAACGRIGGTALPATPAATQQSGTASPAASPSRVPATPEPSLPPATWLRYVDTSLGFSFDYPEAYVRASEGACAPRSLASGELSLGNRIQVVTLPTGGLGLDAYVDQWRQQHLDWDFTRTITRTLGGVPAVTLEYRFGGTGRFGSATLAVWREWAVLAGITAGGFCDLPEAGVSELAAYDRLLDSWHFPAPETPSPAPTLPTATPIPPATSTATTATAIVTHTVQPGDTLFRIAQLYGVTVDALKAANGLTGDLIFAGQVLLIPATGVVPRSPTPAMQAETVTPRAAMPTVTSFTLSAAEVWRGETLTVTWTTTGASEAWLYAYPANEPAGVQAVPVSGSLALPVSATAACQIILRLSAHNAEGPADAWQSVPVTPREPFFFNAGYSGPDCAAGPSTTTQASLQHFEHGRLLWLADRRGIYALFEDGTAAVLGDAWTDDQPQEDPSLVPPPGLLQPVGRLGLAWRSTQWARDRLGWATISQLDYGAITQPGLVVAQDVLGDHVTTQVYVYLPGSTRAGEIVRIARPPNAHQGFTWSVVQP